MTDIESFIVEIHPKHQSFMNQKWLKHSFTRVYVGKWESHTYKATVFKTINRRKRNCNEENSVKQTSCYDNFYMLKLNCYFPWLNSYQG